jgi:hypothetical protein
MPDSHVHHRHNRFPDVPIPPYPNPSSPRVPPFSIFSVTPTIRHVYSSFTDFEQYTFASFISRDSTFDVMMNIWRLCNPNAIMSTISFQSPASVPPPAAVADTTTLPTSAATTGAPVDTPSPVSQGGHAPTECACGKAGQHYSEICLDATFPGDLKQVYELMFASEWYKTFLIENQKLRGMSCPF